MSYTWFEVKEATNYILSIYGYSRYAENISKDIVGGCFNDALPRAMKEALFLENLDRLDRVFSNKSVSDEYVEIASDVDDALLKIVTGYKNLEKFGTIVGENWDETS